MGLGVGRQQGNSEQQNDFAHCEAEPFAIPNESTRIWSHYFDFPTFVSGTFWAKKPKTLF